MAQSQDIRIHQYLDDWLVRAPTRESCHQSTQSFLALCQELGWVVNLQKSELEPKQVFEFVVYQYNLLHDLVMPTQKCWESVLQKVSFLLPNLTYWVRKFKSMVGLLTATEKLVPLCRLHMRPIGGFLSHWKWISQSQDSSPIPSVVDQGSKPRKSYQVSPCTHCVMPFRSLQTPQAKAGVLS